MATHDYVISNQGFPAFRTDLNNAFSAIVSTNSNATEPATKYAYMMWYDSTTNIWKMRNADNDAWISLATFDQVANTVNFLDSAVSIVGLATSATGTVLTLTDTHLNSTVSIRLPDATSISDDSGNEYIKFEKTASAVNEISVTNSATTNPPSISATGGDTNIDLNLTPKGIGRTTFNGQGKIQSVAEKVTTEATSATGTINYDVLTQAVWNFTTDATANWTLNVRGDGSNSLDSIMDTGESITIAHIVSQGATAYYNSAFQIDGSSVTPNWQGGEAPTEGNASSLDTYSYTIIKTASATFTVLASQTQFA
jgi:hypothetical protein